MVTLRRLAHRHTREASPAETSSKSKKSRARSKTLDRSSPEPVSDDERRRSPFRSSNIHDEQFDFAGIQYSPYFLTSGDNPGLAITPELLNGLNYNTWNVAVKTALEAKNKLAFIDGSLPRPPESHQYYRIWSRCNSMVKSWLLNSVTKELYGSILRFNDASQIWQDLLTRFHITNLPRSFHITQQIWSLQQGSMDLSTYFTKLKTLWDDLAGADCVTTCKLCSCCKANAANDENAKIIKFLAGLNESYSQARSQIIMKKTVPDLAGVYNLLDQDFNQRTISPLQYAAAFQVTDSVPLQASVNASFHQHQKPARPMCTYCGYSGHTADKCYKAHGYPPGFKHKQKNPETKPPEKKPIPVVAQVSLAESDNSSVSGMVNNLSKDQIQSVIAYFNSQLQLSGQSTETFNSGGTITVLPGSYQGVDDWSG